MLCTYMHIHVYGIENSCFFRQTEDLALLHQQQALTGVFSERGVMHGKHIFCKISV